MKHFCLSITFIFSCCLSYSQEYARVVVSNGTKLTVYNDYTSFIVTKGRTDTLINVRADYFTITYRDINGDGYVDILADLGGNTPERYDLYLFAPKTRIYHRVSNFSDFPAPVRLPGTKYYFSYHKSGCADMNWDSDLFYLSGSRAICVGNISGRQCQTKDERQGLFIYKVSKSGRKLIAQLNPGTTAGYQEGKWGFIEAYWKRSWKKFVL